MARTARIQVKQLKELTAAMKRGESAIEPAQVKPILAEALDLIRVEALANLRSSGINLGGRLPLRAKYPDARHVEDVLVTSQGKSATRATAWTKVMKKFAPQAWWLEYGHRMVGHENVWGAKKDTGKVVSPKPFFRPAVDAKRKEVRRHIRVGLQALLAKAFGFGTPGNASD